MKFCISTNTCAGTHLTDIGGASEDIILSKRPRVSAQTFEDQIIERLANAIAQSACMQCGYMDNMPIAFNCQNLGRNAANRIVHTPRDTQ